MHHALRSAVCLTIINMALYFLMIFVQFDKKYSLSRIISVNKTTKCKQKDILQLLICQHVL